MSDENEVDKILQETNELYMKGLSLLNKASEKLHHAHYKYPENQNIMLALAANLASSGNIHDPIMIYHEVLNKDDKNIIALVGLAKLNFELNDIPTTISNLKKALELDPNMYEGQMLYAKLHLSSDNIPEAKKIVNHILSQNPSDEQANLLNDRIMHLEQGE